MPTRKSPRKGSLQFWPRKRATKLLPSVNWNAISSGKNLKGFICYKAGMMSAYVRDNTPDSMTKEKKISISDKDDWDSLFFKLFLELVEPHLGKEKPVFVLDYPPSMCALAKKKIENIQWAERFEIYAGGLELANAFTELNDPVEQRFRLENDSLDGLIDENFLSALECAMPPAGGIALGLDRLLMLLLDIDKIEDVLTFHFPIT